MEYSSYQPPASPSASDPNTAFMSIRPLGPFERPPLTRQTMLPDVPTPRTPSSVFTSTNTSTNTHTYTLSTHLIPAAYPRSPFPSGSEPLDTSEYEQIIEEPDKAVREKLIVRYKDTLNAWADQVNFDEHPGRGGDGYRKACEEKKRVMWNCLNRIVRVDDGETEGMERERERITLFVAHANGFSKETYEPALQSLLTQLQESYSDSPSPSPSSSSPSPSPSPSPSLPPIIDEIWLFEAIQHGDSGLINAGLLPRAFDWLDNVRDILHFLLYYMPDRVERPPAVLPTHLPRLSDEVISRRTKEGFSPSGRKIVAIGHSLGGCSIARAAIEHPALFSSVILVDPVLQPMPSDIRQFKFGRLADGALRRRSVWNSREECHASFLKSPFFTSFHPDVLEAYVKYAIAEDKDTGIARLKQSGLHETILFLHLRTSFETCQLLSELDDRIPLFWIVSGLDSTVMGTAETARNTVWRRPANSSNVILPVGHLIPHEAPVAFAALVREFLIKRYGFAAPLQDSQDSSASSDITGPAGVGAGAGANLTTGDSTLRGDIGLRASDSGLSASLAAGTSADSGSGSGSGSLDMHQMKLKSLL